MLSSRSLFRELALLFLFLCVCASVVAQDCPNDCAGQGTCTKGVCKCVQFWGGTDCSHSWAEDRQWRFWFIVLRIEAILFQSIQSACGFYQLYVIARTARKASSHFVTWALIALVVGSLLRLVYFAYDPGAIQGQLPYWVSSLMFNVAIMFWLDAAFLVLLYWVELQQKSTLSLNTVRRLRPALLTCCVLVAATVLPTSVVKSLKGEGTPASYAYYGFLLIFVGAIIFISFHWGRKLLRVAESMYENTRADAFRIFMRKMTMQIFGFNGFLIGEVGVLIAYFPLAGNSWAWLISSLILRFCEFGAVMCMVYVLLKKQPSDGEDSTRRSSDGKSRSGHSSGKISRTSDRSSRTDEHHESGEKASQETRDTEDAQGQEEATA